MEVEGKPEIREIELDGEVGLDCLPYQVMKRSISKGFMFNILCVGESGIGKSTLMCSLFNNNNFDCTPSSHFNLELKLKSNTYNLREGSTDLILTIVETVGYGDQLDKGHNFQPIADYVDKQLENYLQEELKIKRSIHTHLDSRIHVCFYFISPTGRGLKSSDVVCMKSLHRKVNIVPLIAKSDIIIKPELEVFKQNIINELKKENINVYCFPFDDGVYSESSPNTKIPFAVVGSLEFSNVEGRCVRARCYPWGTVDVEDEQHSDFVYLRNIFIENSMEDLRDTTHTNHYELYRSSRLAQITHLKECGDSISLTDIYKQTRECLQKELKAKEDDFKNDFVQKVKRREEELREEEIMLFSKYNKMFKDLTCQENQLEEEKLNLQKDVDTFRKMVKLGIYKQRRPSISDKSISGK